MPAIVRRAIACTANVPIPRAAIEHPTLSLAALGLYCVIAAEGRTCDRGRLLERFGSNPGLLDARLEALVRAGLIERESLRQNPNDRSTADRRQNTRSTALESSGASS